VVKMVKEKTTTEKPKLVVKIEALEELPKGNKLSSATEYDDAIKEILSAEGKVFKVNIGVKTMRQLYSPMAARIKKHNADLTRKEKLQLATRNKQLYIVKSPRKD